MNSQILSKMRKSNYGTSDQTKSILKPEQKPELLSIQQFPISQKINSVKTSNTVNKKHTSPLKFVPVKEFSEINVNPKMRISSKNNSNHFSDSSKFLSSGESNVVSQKLTSLASLNSTNQSTLRDSLSRFKSAVSEKTHSYLNFDLNCSCGLSFYNQILGPTADESFLKGLKTFFNVYKKFMVCDKEPVKFLREVQFQPETVKSVPEILSDILESVGFPPEVASTVIEDSLKLLEEQKPEMFDKILQTSTPQMISEILQAVGLEPELVSAIMQTVSLESAKPISMTSVMIQTSEPQVTEEEKPCVCCQCNIPKEEECDCCPPEDKIVSESKIISKNQSSCQKVRFEKPNPVKFCRCYDCCAPIFYKDKNSRKNCLCSRQKLTSNSRNNADDYVSLARGDTWSLLDTCCCNSN